MANTNAVKDPKNGVISCWVCTGMLVFMNVIRLVGLRMNNKIWDWIFIILIAIWILISVVETVKYRKKKRRNK